MRRIYIFDVDGTLTPSRLQMTKEFEDFFLKWAKKNEFYLVSGSDLPKMKEQVPKNILDLAQGIFTCGGNQLWIKYELQYENKFEPPKDLLEYLEERLENSKYPIRAGNHIEDRGAMVNFSVVGRDCSYEDRLNYFEYDNKNGERKSIIKGRLYA